MLKKAVFFLFLICVMITVPATAIIYTDDPMISAQGQEDHISLDSVDCVARHSANATGLCAVDRDQDSIITINDYMQILKVYLESDSVDMNNDGQVNSADYIYYLMYASEGCNPAELFDFCHHVPEKYIPVAQFCNEQAKFFQRHEYMPVCKY